MNEQAAFGLPLLVVIAERQEIEVVGVAQDLLRHIGALGRQSALEIGDGLPFPLTEPARNHMDQDVLAPAMFESRPKVPFRVGRSLTRYSTRRLWPQGNRAISGCTIASSGHDSAKPAPALPGMQR